MASAASPVIHRFIRDHAAEAARVLESGSLEERISFFSQTPAELAALLFAAMDANVAADCLDRMEAAPSAEALAQVPLERAALLVRRLRPDVRKAILPLLPPDLGKHLEFLLRCRAHTAGSLMEPRILTLPPEISVAEARARLQANPDFASYYLYVVDRDQTLAGVLNLRELLAGREAASVSTLMRRAVVCLRTGDSLTSVLAHPAWLNFHTLPVLDEQGRFAGALRHKTLRRLAGEVEGRARFEQAGTALGELYRIGLSAFVKSAIGAETLPRPSEKKPDQ